MFLLLSGKVDKAREYIDRMLKLNPEDLAGLTLKGWVELFAGRESKIKNTLQLFEAVLQR